MPTPFKWIADFVLTSNSGGSDANPSIIVLPNGQFQIAYADGYASDVDASFNVFSGGGASLSTQNDLEGGSAVNGGQLVGAALLDGRRAYAWTETPTAGGGDLRDVYVEVRYGNSNSGSVDVDRFLIGGGAGEQIDPAIAANLSTGGFAVAYNDLNVAGGQLVMKFFNAAGALINTVSPANTTAGVLGSEGRQVSITGLTNGNYVVAWADGSPFETRAQIFSSGGGVIGSEFTLDAGGDSDVAPAVTALADGRFVVVFADNSPPGEATIGFSGKIFNADGTLAVDTFGIGVGLDNGPLERAPSVAALPDGRFVVVWASDQSPATGSDIFGQVMFADGTKDGARFVVNTDVTGDQANPSVGALPDGRFVVSWTDRNPDIDVIRATIFDPRETNVNMSGTSFNDDMYGTSFGDAFYLGGGNDQARGEAGADYFLGEAGNDTIYGGAGGDIIYGGANDDVLNGDADNDFVYGGVGNDNLSGNDGADFLNGEGTSDTLQGGAGNDTVLGGEGTDLLYGDANDDAMDGGTQNDTLYAGDGADFARGWDGDDAVNGQAGNDQLYGDAGNDTIDGGDGADVIYGGLGNDYALGGAGGDVMIGQEGNDDLRGGADDDSIDGGADNDILYGGDGADFILGGDGLDVLYGEAGSDQLRGEAGADTIVGGAGGDTLFGGTGADRFVFAVGSGVDSINDWTDGEDRIDITGYAGATFGNTVITQSGINVVVTFIGGDQVILLNTTVASLTIADFIV
jgi:Ca2+-binding RTX toxin-like protein